MSGLLAKTFRSSTLKLALMWIGIFGAVVIALLGYVYSSTASFVLSRRQGLHVSAATKQRVIEVASSLGYVPRWASVPTAANV